MKLKINVYRHGDPELWARLGGFLCSRTVHKELGGPIYSTEGVTWLVATEGRKVVGFASMRPANGVVHYDYAYVVESHRKSGVFTRLAEERDALTEDAVRRTVVRESRWKHYAKRGWQELSRRGSWVHGERQP